MIFSAVFTAIIVAVAVVIGVALFSLCRKSSEGLLTSSAAGLIGLALFLSPVLGGVFVGPVTLGEAQLLGVSVAPPILTGLIALAAGLVCLQSLTNPASRGPKSLWPLMALVGAVGLGFVSLLWQWLAIAHGKPVYLDAMLQGWSYLVSLAALLWVIPKLSTNRVVFYALLLCLIAGVGVASGAGTQHFLVQLREHVANPRESATAVNPDFFACLLITTLPLSLVLWLAAPAGDGKRVGLLYALAFLLQFVMLPLTQSRFSLIAAPIGFLVFIGAFLGARRRGMPAVPAMKRRLIILAAIVLLGVAVGYQSIRHRFERGVMAAQSHSGEFRIWTWKGEATLIEDHPLFGTGPGSFAYAYPRYALVGFASHAHNSYLQIAGDIGVPGLLLVLAAFGGAFFLGVKALIAPKAKEDEVAPTVAHPAKKKGRRAEPVPTQESPGESFIDQVAPPDDGWVLIGLLGGLVAGLVQNLIDSDFYLFFNGVVIVSVAGFILALAPLQEPVEPKPRRPLLVGAIALCALVFLGMLWTGVATGYAAAGDYQTAQGMEPLNGAFTSLLGWRVDMAQGRAQDAEQMLTSATQLAPDGISFMHLGDFYSYAKEPDKAVAMYVNGLRYDPNSLELLLKAAQTEDALGQHEDALRDYTKMVALQQGPYGTIRAITEITEYRYAYADTAVGDQLMAQRNLPAALSAYQLGQRILQTYANEGGSRNPMREATNDFKPNPTMDQGLQQVYQHVMAQMEEIDQRLGHADQAAALRVKEAEILPKFSG